MFFLYNLILLLSLFLLSPLILFKIISDKRYRTGLSERLGNVPESVLDALAGQRPIWFHAASVGEVIASVRLIEEMKRKWPDRKLIVSTFTPTGNLTAREKLKADGVIFLPLDFPFVVGMVLKRVNPSVLILMETELWPNLIRKAGNMDIPVVVVNGRISDRSYGKYWFISPLLKKVFAHVTRFLMQSDGDAGRIITLGAEPSRVTVTGNIKFDLELKNGPIPFMEKWGGPVFIAGSTRMGEDPIILDIYRELRDKYPALKLVIAPRHLERTKEVEGILEEKGLQYLRRSEIKGNPGSSIVLLDTLGELASMYKYADLVFMGGSLVPVGGHNPVEPAGYGRPVLFGPHMENFREAARILVESGGGVMVKDEAELRTRVDKLLSDKELCDSLGEKAREAVLKNQGATERTLDVLSKL